MSDISAMGAGVVHKGQFPLGFEGLLNFDWECLKIELQCSVARTSLERDRRGAIALTVYHSGLVFKPVTSDAVARTQAAMAEAVTEAIQHQKANAFAVSLDKAAEMPHFVVPGETERKDLPPLNLNGLFDSLAGGAGRYVCCSLEGQRWSTKSVTTPEQPGEGFTVSAEETRHEIDTLCFTYQNADADGRKLIRTFAHLTIAEPNDTPRDLY